MIYLYFLKIHHLISCFLRSPFFHLFLHVFEICENLKKINQCFPQGFLYIATIIQNLPSNCTMLLPLQCKKLVIIYFLLYCVSLLPRFCFHVCYYCTICHYYFCLMQSVTFRVIKIGENLPYMYLYCIHYCVYSLLCILSS